MGQAKQKSPDAMPSDEAVAKASNKLSVSMLAVGSRGESRRRRPSFDIHSVYRVRGGSLAELAGKRIIIFVHGYNVNAPEALESSVAFFGKMQAALERDGANPSDSGYLAFTWPGDVGPIYFNVAQKFAQHSGVALYKLVRDLQEKHNANGIILVTHSLGAHVGLRSAAVLGERVFRRKTRTRYTHVLMLAPAVENDVFRRAVLLERYHFPESAFGMRRLHIFTSRADNVLSTAFAVSEMDKALGYAGPQSMKPLKSLSRRVYEASGEKDRFDFEVHDFSPTSTTIMNPALHANSHGDYWGRAAQADYYANLIG